MNVDTNYDTQFSLLYSYGCLRTSTKSLFSHINIAPKTMMTIIRVLYRFECHTNPKSPYQCSYRVPYEHKRTIIPFHIRHTCVLYLPCSKCVALISHQHTFGRYLLSFGARYVRMQHSHSPYHQIFPV